MSFTTRMSGLDYSNKSKSLKAHKKLSINKLSIWTATAIALGTVGFLSIASCPNITSNTSATSADLNVKVNVPVYLSLAIQDLSSSPIDTVSAEISNGARGMTNTAKVIASTNSANGYTLTLADNDNITDLAPYDSTTGTYDITGPKITPVSSDLPLSSFSPNTWGYAVVYSNTNTDTPTAPTTFGPMTTNPVELYTEVTGPGTGYHYFTAAAMVGDALPAGTYEDKVMFSLTAAPEPEPYIPSYTIIDVQPNTYIDPNGGEIITVITDATANDSTTAFTVSSVTVGGTACTNPTVTTTPGTNATSYRVIVCTAPAKSTGTYDVVANITDTTTGNPAILTKTNAVEYATVQFGGISSMQDMTASVCNAVTTGTTGALKDARDNQIYRVFKALDGNCWMSENLRYGAMPETADSPTARPYNSTDDALSDNMDTTNMVKLTDSRICKDSSGCKDGSVNMFYNNTEGFTNPQIIIYQANTSATYDGKTKYGALYNYCAVTGGTACTASSTFYNPTGSVCPKGWKLPGMIGDPTGSGTGTTDGSVKTYDNVFSLYGVTTDSAGFNKIIASPFNFVRSGDARDGSLLSRFSSRIGYYWSSTKCTNALDAYDLYFSSGYVGRDGYGRYVGYSARCISE